ncbi:hypothetical protein Tco_0216463 [Tanacetum coccineum]
MSALKFTDSHNMVAFLAKPTESKGFEQIVDLLNVNPIKYALTVNPTIYTSCIEQFWATAKVETVNGEVQLHALVDRKKNVDSSVKFLMYPRVKKGFSGAVTPLFPTMMVQDQEEMGEGSRTHKLKRLFKVGRSTQVVSSEDEGLGDQEDASKQGRKITDIDQDAEVTLVDETQGRYNDAQMFDTYVFNGEDVFVAEKSEKVSKKYAKPKVVVQEPVQSTTTTTPSTIPKAKSITFRDPGESTTRTTLTPIPSNIKDKGKAKMMKLWRIPLIDKKRTNRLDEELAFKLQAEEEEQARLAREKAEEVKEANISWDNVQAMIEADRLLAERLQAREQEELTDEEKARLFIELLEKRKKHFAALRAQEKRNKPPTKAQKKSTMSTYLKHMAGYKQKQEPSKKQKMKDDKETSELQSMMQVIPDEEEVAVDAIPLATKPPSIVD